MGEQERLTPSGEKVLRALGKGDATFEDLRIRLRPMSDQGITRSLYHLDLAGLIDFREHGALAGLTDAGHERLREGGER